MYVTSIVPSIYLPSSLPTTFTNSNPTISFLVVLYFSPTTSEVSIGSIISLPYSSTYLATTVFNFPYTNVTSIVSLLYNPFLFPSTLMILYPAKSNCGAS